MTANRPGVTPDEILPPDGGGIQMRRLVTDALLVLPNIIKLVARLLRDPRVPRRSKVALGLAAAYVASPIDFIPAVILPIVGWVDDVVLIMYAIDSLVQRAGPEIVEEHWDGPVDLLGLVRDVVGMSRTILPKRVTSVLDRLSG
jgi:uncharacterized membrane protein YkvA (DUF1232 family)